MPYPGTIEVYSNDAGDHVLVVVTSSDIGGTHLEPLILDPIVARNVGRALIEAADKCLANKQIDN